MTWQALLQFLFTLLILLIVARIIAMKDNEMEFGDLVSVRTAEGRQRASWDEIGKGLGAIVAFYVPMHYAHSAKFDAIDGSILMGTSLAYLGAVKGYSAYLRSKQGTVQTVTEPAPTPTPIKKTVTETPPITPAKQDT